MASGAPRAAETGRQNPAWNGLPGRTMGGGCQGNAGAVQYAHAVPPFRNCGAMVVLVQRAYFSAWRMVFEVPSVMSARRGLPYGPVVAGGLVGMVFRAGNQALRP